MSNQFIKSDRLIFTPDDVDLSFSPLRKFLDVKTFVLGAFNPGFCRLPSGNLLMMVRVAEALSNAVISDQAYTLRWDEEKGYLAEGWPLSEVNMQDPRKFKIKVYPFPVFALTSISWLLPVELNEDGSEVRQVHYDKIISSASTSQEYGIEDPRITFIDGHYYMTTCCVSSERHSTQLYRSEDGLNYRNLGIVLDHQNKDMLLFEGQLEGLYYALTRPLGECYFATAPSSIYHPGAAIHLATSPDLLFWKPSGKPFLRARRSSTANVKIGGGTPPILTPQGWLMLYHGVQNKGDAGIYRTFWAMLDKEDPAKILSIHDATPLLEANPDLTASISHQVYLPDIVFTTGIVDHEEDYIIASGELDLACRISRISKNHFLIKE